jgi:DNA-directed RNA polymerase specialized sigma24 family protein
MNMMTGASIARRPTRAKDYVRRLQALVQKLAHAQAAKPDTFESRGKRGLKTFEPPTRADTRTPEQQLLDAEPDARPARAREQRARKRHISHAVHQLHKAIKGLPPLEQAAALLQLERPELSIKQLAELADTNEDTFSARLRRAVVHLAEAMPGHEKLFPRAVFCDAADDMVIKGESERARTKVPCNPDEEASAGRRTWWPRTGDAVWFPRGSQWCPPEGSARRYEGMPANDELHIRGLIDREEVAALERSRTCEERKQARQEIARYIAERSNRMEALRKVRDRTPPLPRPRARTLREFNERQAEARWDARSQFIKYGALTNDQQS